jgi:hypothetical protein
LKGSNETSAKATASQRIDRSSANSISPPSHTSVEQYGLTGPSNLPDPRFHAYRPDLADAALAGRVIASHYAEPVEKFVVSNTALRAAPSVDAEELAEMEPEDPFSMLDDTLGWAWGYAGRDRVVGYVRSEALG